MWEPKGGREERQTNGQKDRPITSTKSVNSAKDENNKVINRQHFKDSYYKYGQEFKEKYKQITGKLVSKGQPH